jgi:hypothetical protein
MDIKKYLVQYTKAEYDERNRAEFEAEHECIEKDKIFNSHVKKSVIEERKDREREQAKVRKQRQREWEREQEIEAGKRDSNGTLITRKVSHILINKVK